MHLNIIANFKEFHYKDEICSGLRDMSIPYAIAHELWNYFTINCIDASHLEEREYSFSRAFGNNPGTYLIIQNHVKISQVDVPNVKIFYIHIDGHFSVPHCIAGFKLWNAPSKHDYEFGEKEFHSIYPFIGNTFHADRDKDLYITSISRTIDFEVYKDILERSKFTIVFAPHWLSKRAFEALACKTVPIIVTRTPELYRELGFNETNCYLIDYHADTYIFAREAYPYLAETGYQFVMTRHHIKNRIKKIVEVIKKYG